MDLQALLTSMLSCCFQNSSEVQPCSKDFPCVRLQCPIVVSQQFASLRSEEGCLHLALAGGILIRFISLLQCSLSTLLPGCRRGQQFCISHSSIAGGEMVTTAGIAEYGIWFSKCLRVAVAAQNGSDPEKLPSMGPFLRG